MSAETLNADFYRQHAQMCHKLAATAQDAKPLFTRLFSLAKAYEEKAEEAEWAGRRGVKASGALNRPMPSPAQAR
jgi:hypothetical protein